MSLRLVVFRNLGITAVLAGLLSIAGPAAAQAPDQGLAAKKDDSRSANLASSHNSHSTLTPDLNYVIGEGDVLAIDVWHEQELSRVVPVRPDGKISLPLLGDMQASGQTPLQLQQAITRQVKDYVENPQVSVIVQETKSQTFNVVGEVQKPGAFVFTHPVTVLDAVALAGGFRDFAKSKKMYVLRTVADGTQHKLPVNYKEIIKGKKPEENVVLQSHDTVVVP